MDEASKCSGQLGPVSQSVPERQLRLFSSSPPQTAGPFSYFSFSPEAIRLVVMIYVRRSNRTRAGPNL